jgi:hypothetical protein
MHLAQLLCAQWNCHNVKLKNYTPHLPDLQTIHAEKNGIFCEYFKLDHAITKFS